MKTEETNKSFLKKFKLKDLYVKDLYELKDLYEKYGYDFSPFENMQIRFINFVEVRKEIIKLNKGIDEAIKNWENEN